MRALLVVNPAATTTSARTREVLTHALASDLKLEVAQTQYRGHARDLARQATEGGETDLVVALGGDGTVNEVVNGLLANGPDPDSHPRLAVVPGGSTNVFARALGLPNDVVEATGALLDALRDGSERTIGLGLAAGTPGSEDEGVPERWFTFCAGFGFDAGVVGRVEQQRERGKRSTHALYVRQVVRQFLIEANRRRGVLTLERPGGTEGAAETVENLALAIICNTAPWTYLGNRPIYPSPDASFDTALDLFALSKLTVRGGPLCDPVADVNTPARAPRQTRPLTSRPHELHLAFAGPLPFQMDGDHLGLRTSVTFTGVRRALRVIV